MKSKIYKNAITVILLFIIINNFIFAPGNILSWDVFGYYLYLPLKFIYHDLGLHNYSTLTGIVDKYHNTATLYQALDMPNGGYVMKYPMGLSFLYAPFFFIGHIIAVVFNYPADGFSAPYQYSIFIGGIIYSIIGIWALSKVLLRFFDDRVVLLVLLLIVFSTNYLVHITMYGQNAMSHNYLFTTYALMIWLTILWHESHKMKYAILLAILCGLTILSRPSEIVCLMIPTLWGIKNSTSLKEKLTLLSKNKIQLIVFALIVFSFGLCQFIYWKIFTGKFLFYSYGINAGEGFEFLHSHIVEVLFSFRKGWLIYTPVMFFAIAGFYFIYKSNRSIFYALFIYFIINLFVVSCWSTWWYASSFSQRALIPSYPVMAIGLGYFLTWLNKQSIFKAIIYTLIIGCVLLNLFQTKQFHYGIIDGERMTSAYYFSVFGKMTATEEDKKLLLINRSFENGETFTNEQEYNSKLLQKLDFENSDQKDATRSYSGKYSFRLDSSNLNSPVIEAPYSQITNKDHAWIRVTAYIYPTQDTATDPFCLIIRFIHNGYPYKNIIYNSEMMNLELNKWNKITFDYLTPEVRRNSDQIKIYFQHKGKAPVYIDDFEADVFEKK